MEKGKREKENGRMASKKKTEKTQSKVPSTFYAETQVRL